MKRHVDPSEGTKKLKSKNKRKGKKPKTAISQIKLMHSLWSFFFRFNFPLPATLGFYGTTLNLVNLWMNLGM